MYFSMLLELNLDIITGRDYSKVEIANDNLKQGSFDLVMLSQFGPRLQN